MTACANGATRLRECGAVARRQCGLMSSNARLVQRAGLAVAAIGLVLAAAAWLHAGPDDEIDAVEHRREMQQLERLGGTASVRTAEFDRWLSSMWHGRRLAVTLAVLGLVVGGACWRVGVLMGEGADEGAT